MPFFSKNKGSKKSSKPTKAKEEVEKQVNIFLIPIFPIILSTKYYQSINCRKLCKTIN